jgi:hypothetical protein
MMSLQVPYLALAAMLAYAAATAFFPALVLAQGKRIRALIVLCLPILLSPCLIPLDRHLVRFVAAVLAVSLIVKLVDLNVGLRKTGTPALRTFLGFLLNPFSFVQRKLAAEPRLSRRQNFLRLLGGLVGLLAGVAVMTVLFHLDWRSCPFVTEHCAKVGGLYLAVLPGLAAAAAAWRLMGGSAREPMDHPELAVTPADFWRRYNRLIQQFFFEDVFRPLGGQRAPVRATFLVFAISAVLHEYLFSIAIGRVQGYQTLFFLLQGLVVIATQRVRPRDWRRLPWMAGTLVFNMASSVLFFASMNGIVEFYARDMPAWCRGW